VSRTTNRERNFIFDILLAGVILTLAGEIGLVIDALMSGKWWVYILIACQLIGTILIGIWGAIHKSIRS